MMDKQNVNGFHSKASVNGHQRRQVPYSVETPYGFRLDLDFLKYVDDIEKGNTIKRVHIQRRSRAPKLSTLHRNFSLPGYTYRAPWASTPALVPNAKSRLAEAQQVLEFGACEDGPSGVSGSPRVSYVTLRAMEDASIRAFDEQPLGVHVRPYLLRATSMPLTTLQRTNSEASGDRAAPAHGGPCSENGSSEDEFGVRRGASPSSGPGLRLQLAAAIQKIGELEEQARTVRELRAQITALREDKDRLHLRLRPRREGQDAECEQREPRLPDTVAETPLLPGGQAILRPTSGEEVVRDTDRGDRGSTSRRNGSDTNPLSVTGLQDRIAGLEQKLCRASAELEESTAHLKELTQENKLKEDKIKRLTDRGRVEPGANQDAVTAESNAHLTSSSTQTDAAVAHTLTAEKLPEAPPSACNQVVGGDPLELQGSGASAENPADEVLPGSPEEGSEGESLQRPEDLEPSRPTTHGAVGLYIARIEGLLQEQWECMGQGDPDNTLQKPGSKISSIQAELLNSIHTLSTLCTSPAQTTGATHQAALKSIMKKSASTEGLGVGAAKKNLKFVGVNGGYETTSSEDSSSEGSIEERREEDAVGVGGGGAGKPEAPGPREGPHQEQPGRELVNEDFTAACCSLKDCLEEVACPNEKMRQVLMVVYEVWFHVSSQKESTAETVALYLKQAESYGPAMLRFLVNLADGNNNMALHYSASHSNFAIVKLLLDTGLCDVDHRNKAGYTAIMLASLTAADAPEDMEVARQLMEQADINARASQAGQTALMLAVSHGCTPMVRLLLAGRADVNMQDQHGSTPLMSACENGHTHIARLLLEHRDCDPSLTDNEGHTALSVALSSSHSEIADLLRAYSDAGPSSSTRPL